MEEQAQIFAPMVLMPLYYSYVAPSPMPAAETAIELEPKLCEDHSSSSSNSTWHDELYGILCNIYENQRKWHVVEDGVCLRANSLFLLDQCFVEDDNGDYHQWGKPIEFASLADELSSNYSGVAHVNIETMKVHVHVPKQETLVMPMIPGLRYIRSIPTILAIMTCGESPRLFCHVEAYWQDDKEKEKRSIKDYIQQELVMALLRSKHRGHMSFW